MRNEELILLLKHFTDRPQDLETVGEVLHRMGTFRKAPAALAVFFDRALDYWNSYKSRITFEELAMCFRDSGLSSQYDRQILDNIRKWYEQGTLQEPLSRERLRDLVNEAKVEAVSSRMSIQGEIPGDDIDEMTQWFADRQKELGDDPLGGEDGLWNPADPKNDPWSPDTEADLRVKIPLGVEWLDMGQGGGMRPGETVGIIAPTGGGKTTLGLQIANALVNAGRCVGYLTLEQMFAGDLQRRINILASESTRDEWEDIVAVPQHLRERWYAKSPLWDQYFIGDERFLKNPDLELKTPRQIFEPMVDYFEQKHNQWVKDGRPATVNEPKLDTVIIDWYGELLQLWKKTHVYGKDSSSFREAAMNLKKGLKDWAGYYNIRLVVLHQTKGQEAKSRKLSSHDAQEDSNFGDRMNYCWGLSSNDDDQGLVWAYMSKGREAARVTLPLKMDAQRIRFVMDDPDTGGRKMTDRMASGYTAGGIDLSAYGAGKTL